MQINLKVEGESKAGIHSPKVMFMLPQSKYLNKNKFIIISLKRLTDAVTCTYT